MGQILTNRTGREKILVQGEKPEIKITAKQACEKYNIKKIVEDQWRA